MIGPHEWEDENGLPWDGIDSNAFCAGCQGTPAQHRTKPVNIASLKAAVMGLPDPSEDDDAYRMGWCVKADVLGLLDAA